MQPPTTAFNVAPASSEGMAGYPARVKAKLITPPGATGSTPTSNSHTISSPPAIPGSLLASSNTPSSIMDSNIDPQLLAETNASTVNLRLERAKANAENKRKSDGKAAASSNKKIKIKATGLAVPNSSNTLKYVPRSYSTDI